MLAKFLVALGFIAAIVLLFFISFTTPATAGPLGILVVFVCIYGLLLVGLTFSLVAMSRLIARTLGSFAVRRPLGTLTLLRSYYLSSILALAPAMLLGMQSIGGIGIYEFSLVVVFVVIAMLYVTKRTE